MGAPPTYGNWNRPSEPGLWRLGFVGTAVLFVSFVFLIIISLLGIVYVAITLFLLVVYFIPLIYRDRYDRSGWDILLTNFAWSAKKRKKYDSYKRSVEDPRKGINLPSLGSNIFLVRTHHQPDGNFVYLWHKGLEQVSLVFDCSPAGNSLVDSAQINSQVSQWGRWLANFGNEQDFLGANVTIESIPDNGLRLKDNVEQSLDPSAPILSRNVLKEIVDDWPAKSSIVKCLISLTWRVRPDDIDFFIDETNSKVPEFKQGLSTTGAGYAQPLDENGLADVIRSSFDLEYAIFPKEGINFKPSWQHAGVPVTCEHKNYFEHRDAFSVSWFMSDAPKSNVQSNILEKLLAPNLDLDSKRVTIMYRPFDTVDSKRLIDSEIKNTRFALGQAKNRKASLALQFNSAEQAEQEEARGAVLVRFAMVVTASKRGEPNRENINRLTSIVEHSAKASRINLRKADCFQATTFMLGLPLGIISRGYTKTVGK